MDLAAEQPSDLAADRQSKARSAVLAAGGSISLAERLPDDLLLVFRIPMPVSWTSNAIT
jgi:hypothetical protein